MGFGELFLKLVTKCWRVGRAFSIDVRIHWTFWIVPAAVFFYTFNKGWRVVAFSEALAFAILGCVLLHEYGHALMARYFGCRTRDIIMTPLGGIARLEKMPETPVQEILVALAGPAVNVIIAGPMLMALTLFGEPLTAVTNKGVVVATIWDFLWLLAYGNAGLAMFNMLPAFPSDGGRVLRAVLNLFVNRVTATQAAAYLGIFVAVGLGVLGLVTGNLQLPLIAVLFAFIGQMELQMVKRQEERRGQIWVESQRIPSHYVHQFVAPEPGFSGYAWEPRLQMWVEWRDGWPVRICQVCGWDRL